MTYRFLRVFFLTCLIVTASACQISPTKQYYWGNYEALIYERFDNQNSVDINAEARAFEHIINKSSEVNRPIAPGIYAHLGYLYSLQGQLELAKQTLNMEKQLFPESAVYINRLIANIDKISKGAHATF